MQTATAEIEVENPDAVRRPFATHYRGVTTYNEPKEFRIRRPQNLQSDPLGQMHRRRQLGPLAKADILLDAGRKLQETHEAAGQHLRSPGDIRELVDGGQIAHGGPTTKQMAAARSIARWQRAVEIEHGKAGWQVVVAVCIDKDTLARAALKLHHEATRANEAYVGRILREALLTLARAQARR